MDADNTASPSKLVECRICHEEDEESNTKTPCSCSGSIKYTHRQRIQRWCDEKCDTTCEICSQQFEPGYTPSPPLFQCDGVPVDFRGKIGRFQEGICIILGLWLWLPLMATLWILTLTTIQLPVHAV